MLNIPIRAGTILKCNVPIQKKPVGKVPPLALLYGAGWGFEPRGLSREHL